MKEKIHQLVKSFIKKSPLYIPLRNKLSKWRQRKALSNWEWNNGALPVPHLVKQRVLEELAQQYKLSILVETGTYYGDMVEAMKDKFDRIYSIELDRRLHVLAQKRFAGNPRVCLLCGDSGREIKYILPALKQPALFWLDAHYSAGITARADKDTPILDELDHILRDSAHHVVVIDDARCFGGDPAYPSFEQLKAFASGIRPGAEIRVEDDSIRILPIAA